MSLPNISPNVFIRRGRVYYYISDENTEHRITRAGVIANGTKDLCLASGVSSRDYKIQRISETPPEKIIWIPKGDILFLEIEPSYNGCPTMYLDVRGGGEATLELIVDMVKIWGPKISVGEDYAMYGGIDYSFDPSSRKCSYMSCFLKATRTVVTTNNGRIFHVCSEHAKLLLRRHSDAAIKK